MDEQAAGAQAERFTSEDVLGVRKGETMKPKNKIIFMDYQYYPKEIMDACRFRDEYDNLPDGAFFEVARELGLYDALDDMAEWESKNTYHTEERH